MKCHVAGALVVLLGCSPQKPASSDAGETDETETDETETDETETGETETGGELCGTPDACWVEPFGTDADDEAASVAFDPTGNLIVVGNTDGALAEGDAGSYDAFVSKRCMDGSPVWTRQFGNDEIDAAADVAVDAEGNLYITGVLSAEEAMANPEAFITKYTPDGDRAWLVTLGTGEGEVGNVIALGPAGTIHIAGITYGDLGGPSYGGHDAFAAAYESDGELLWVVQLGTTSEDGAYAMTVDDAGNMYVAGTVEAALDGMDVAGATDVFLAKYDASGTLEWTRVFGTLSYDGPSDLAAAPDGGVYMTGEVGPDQGLDGNASLGQQDGFLRRYEPDGTALWTVQFGTDDADSSTSVVIGDDGNVLVLGVTDGTFPGQTSAGLTDSFLIDFTPEGTQLSTLQFGTAGEDAARSIALDGPDVYVAGRVRDPLDDSVDAFVMRPCE